MPKARLGAATSLALLLLSLSSLGQADGSLARSEPSTAAKGLEPSVVGVWLLDERTGTTTQDSSGKAHHGVRIGSVRLGVAGKFNTGYRFVPKGAVIVRNAPELVPRAARITISYWLKLITPPLIADYDILVKGDSSSRGGQIKLEVQRNGQASCMFRGALGQKQLQAGPDVIDGRWHHVICQRVGDRIVQTVDGKTASVTKATGAITVTDPVRLGSHRHKGDWYKGVLDEVTYRLG